MNLFVLLIVRVLYLLTGLSELLLLIRAIMSWFPGVGGRFSDIIYSLTEPLLYPVRKLFELFNVNFGAFPLDIPFLVTFILISVIQTFLGAALI